MNPEERKFALIALFIGIFSCIAGWLALPQIQRFLSPPETTVITTLTSSPTIEVTASSTFTAIAPTFSPTSGVLATAQQVVQTTPIPQVPGSNNNVPPANTFPPPATSTEVPIPTATLRPEFLFEWSTWYVCGTDPDVIENRVRNLNQVEVQVIGFIKAKPNGGQEETISEVPPPYQICEPGAWCGPGERIRNRYPEGFQGEVWGVTSIYYLGREVGSKTFGPIQLSCPS